MNLTTDHSDGAYAVRVQCFACKAMLLLADAIIDLDGPAFEAYYHRGCIPFGAEFPNSCKRPGCARPECRRISP